MDGRVRVDLYIHSEAKGTTSCTLFIPVLPSKTLGQLWGCGPSFPNSLLFQGGKSDLMTLEVALLTCGYLI